MHFWAFREEPDYRYLATKAKSFFVVLSQCGGTHQFRVGVVHLCRWWHFWLKGRCPPRGWLWSLAGSCEGEETLTKAKGIFHCQNLFGLHRTSLTEAAALSKTFVEAFRNLHLHPIAWNMSRTLFQCQPEHIPPPSDWIAFAEVPVLWWSGLSRLGSGRN